MVLPILSRGLRECIQDGDIALLESYLRAILHFVQPTRPSGTKNQEILSLFEEPLLRIHVLKRGIYEVTLLVKASIASPLCSGFDVPELLKTAIPILNQCPESNFESLTTGHLGVYIGQ
jgi:hypothetical protein